MGSRLIQKYIYLIIQQKRQMKYEIKYLPISLSPYTIYELLTCSILLK